MRALIVEGELKLASLMRRGLREAGYATDVVPSGERAIRMAMAVEYDMIVLDAMLPVIDGFELRRRLRRSGGGSPALMLAPREAVDDRSAGLDSGADDYPESVSVAELFHRLGAIRRGRVKRPLTLQVGTLRVDPARARLGAETSRSNSRRKGSLCSKR